MWFTSFSKYTAPTVELEWLEGRLTLTRHITDLYLDVTINYQWEIQNGIILIKVVK